MIRQNDLLKTKLHKTLWGLSPFRLLASPHTNRPGPGVFICLGALMCGMAHADSISNYMNIASNIPQMQMKADAQSQSWARSARNVLLVSTDSIADALKIANEKATSQGSPLFCPPVGESISSTMLDGVIQQTYSSLQHSPQFNNNMSVSEVALIGLANKYPCIGNKAQNKPNVPLDAYGNPVPQQFVQANPEPYNHPPTP